MGYYDMDGVEITQSEWAALFGSSRRVVGNHRVNGFHISTVWLGLHHGEGALTIFETMVFCHGGTVFECRYPTFAQAKAGHRKAVDMVVDGDFDE